MIIGHLIRAGLLLALCLAGLVEQGRAADGTWLTTVDSREESTLRVGDVLTVFQPGETVLNKDYQLDRLGQISLPEVGPLPLSGMTMEQAESAIKAKLGVAYRDLDRLSVKLKERRLLVTVNGYVKTPGGVDIPGDANVQNAIAAAGGLVEGAQLDRIQFSRNGVTSIFDYKKYLETGDLKLLPKLEPLDKIFVPSSPVTGNVYVNFDGRTLAQAGDGGDERASIKIFGEVSTPAAYAYRPGATIVDMLLRAGGVTRYAATEQIRIISQGEPVTFNLQRYLDSGDAKTMPPLGPGATIFVPKVIEEVRSGARTVYVMGEVAKPGAYELQGNSGFIEILANSGGPTRFADTRHIRVIKQGGTIEQADLTAFTENPGRTLPSLKPGDAIFVPEKTETNEPSWLKVNPNRAVEVLGAVVKPGRYEWSDEMSLFDLIGAAGGPGPKGDLGHIHVLEKRDGAAQPVVFDAKRFIQRGGSLSQLPRIQAGYVIFVPELPTDVIDNKTQWLKLPTDQSIYIMGEVGRPGRYAFNDSMHFLDILAAADGPTPRADLTNIRIAKRGRRNGKVLRINLQRYFLVGDGSLIPKLATGDVIYLPDQTVEFADAPRQDMVTVLGAVAKPGKYIFGEYLTILDVLSAAGGPASTALQSKILVVNMSGADRKSTFFNLPKFAKTADTRLLPVLRAGDVVYVPDESQDDLRALATVMKNISDIASPYLVFKPTGSK